jgi:hypothetical protein
MQTSLIIKGLQKTLKKIANNVLFILKCYFYSVDLYYNNSINN